MWRALLAPALLVPLLSGCLDGGPANASDPTDEFPGLPADLQMDRFQATAFDAISGVWQWQDVVPAYAGLGVGSPPPALASRFQVPEGLPVRIDLTIDFERPPLGLLRMSLTDEAGHVLCTGPCSLARQEPFPARETWTVQVWQSTWPEADIPFSARLALTAIQSPAVAPIAFGEDGPRRLPPGLEGTRFVVHQTGLPASEPTIGVTSTGQLFTPSEPLRKAPAARTEDDVLTVLRSLDGGRHWDALALPAITPLDVDPWLWVDPDTDRVFRLALLGTCSQMAVSDDNGRSWVGSQLDGCGLPGGHYQKLTTGPPPPGVATQGYPNVVYYASSLLADYLTDGLLVGHTAGVWVSPSLDGGGSWQPGALAHPARRGCYGWGGPVVVAPDGTAYSPAQFCDGIRIAVSHDAGRTWQEDAMLADEGHMGGFLGPSMAADSDGRLYLVYPADDGQAILRIRDPVTGTWSARASIMPPGVRAATFTLVDAVGPGQIAMAFLGTTSDPASWAAVDPVAAPLDADWHLHVVLSWNALADDPTFVAFQATPDDDPVQRGCIDLAGSQTSTCRNLADFMDMTLLQGRPIVAFADGCIRCASAAESQNRMLSLAVLDKGIGLDGKPLEGY